MKAGFATKSVAVVSLSVQLNRSRKRTSVQNCIFTTNQRLLQKSSSQFSYNVLNLVNSFHLKYVLPCLYVFSLKCKIAHFLNIHAKVKIHRHSEHATEVLTTHKYYINQIALFGYFKELTQFLEDTSDGVGVRV